MRSGDAAAPRTVALRVAGVQSAVGIFIWLVVGYWNARYVVLFEPGQDRLFRTAFFVGVPLVGLLGVAILPALWAHRLAREVDSEESLRNDLVTRLHAFPRVVALLDIAATVTLFLLAALRAQYVASAPAIESAKIDVLGAITGVLFGIFSYFVLQPVLRPLLLAAVRRGAELPPEPSFPLTQKIIACVLAVAFVVAGLFGEIALSWAQRFAEARSEERARTLLRTLARDEATLRLRDSAGWERYLETTPLPFGDITVLVEDAQGRILTSAPRDPGPVEEAILHSPDLRHAIEHLGNGGALEVRHGAPRIVTSMLLDNGGRLLAFNAPDPFVIRKFLWSVLLLAVELLVLSVGLAWVVGLGLTRPIRELEERTREFARNPDVPVFELDPADDELGSVSYSFMKMAGDIRVTQDRLRESERRAATAELLAGVSHEVRNPLFGITSTIAALEQELADDPRFREHFAVIRKESGRLSRMMEEMLALQRRPRRSGGRVVLRPLMLEAADSVRSRFPRRTIETTIDCPDALVLPDADEDRIRSVFTNLIENAVLASEDPARIQLSAVRDRGEVAIRVEDHGIGVPPELIDRLFEPFVTGRSGGTGVGLAICRQVVSEHGGTISVSSQAGRTTVFLIQFPVPETSTPIP
jgi:signal transduction histidine kinase